MITNVSKVAVPVEDQQAALEFWATTMGFRVVRDDTYGDERWIEVTPPHQDLLLVLARGGPTSRGARPPIGCHTRTCSSPVPTSRPPTPNSTNAA